MQPSRTKVYRLLDKFIPENGNFNRGLSLTVQDLVLQPLKGGGYEEKRICYNRQRPSIYVDDWKDSDVDKIIGTTPKIEWPNQPEFYVDPLRNKNLTLFLDISNQNKSNPHRDTTVEAVFYEVDRDAIAEDNIADDKQATLAKAAAYDGDIDKLREVMFLMGMLRTNRHGEAWTDKQIRDAALQEISKGREGEFMDYWTDPQVYYRINLNKAIAIGIIKFDENTGEVKWGDNGNPVKMGKIPYGRDWKDYLIKWISGGGKGETFYQELSDALMSELDPEEASNKFRGHINSKINEMTPEKTAEKAMEFNLVSRHTPYYYFGSEKIEKNRIGRSKDDLINAIKDNITIDGVKITDVIKAKLKIKMS